MKVRPRRTAPRRLPTRGLHQHQRGLRRRRPSQRLPAPMTSFSDPMVNLLPSGKRPSYARVRQQSRIWSAVKLLLARRRPDSVVTISAVRSINQVVAINRVDSGISTVRAAIVAVVDAVAEGATRDPREKIATVSRHRTELRVSRSTRRRRKSPVISICATKGTDSCASRGISRAATTPTSRSNSRVSTDCARVTSSPEWRAAPVATRRTPH